MFDAQFSKEFLKSIEKLSKKDRQTSIELRKKLLQIISSDETSIEHYKNLKKPLQDYKRVHVGSYVVLFRIKDKIVYFEKFEHHDDVYEM